MMFVRLFSCRLQWYRTQMLEKLIRFKHVVVIVTALFIAPLHIFHALFVQPVINIGYSKHPGMSLVISLILMQLIYLLWIVFQADAINNTRVKKYINALPISPVQHYLSDILMLTIANNIFWIPILAALLNAPYAAMTAPLTFVVKMLVLTASILAIQMQWMHRQYFSLMFIFMADLVYYTGSISTTSWVSLLLVLLSFFISLLLTYPWRFNFTILSRFSSFQNTGNIISLSGHARFQLIKLTYKVLIKKYYIECFTRCVISMALLLFGYFAIVFGDSIKANLWSVTLLSMVVLTFSGFFPLLKEAREQYKIYFDALPISQFHWYLLDYLTITMIIILSASLYTFLLWMNQKLTFIESVWMLVSTSMLSLFLCYIRNKYQKFNTFFSMLATVAWVSFTSCLFIGAAS